VPTTLPTMDELLGRAKDIPGTLMSSLGPGTNVFTLHAEIEGGPLFSTFAKFIDDVRLTGAELVRLDTIAARALAGAGGLPTAPITRDWVAGRSGWIAAQGASLC
jgi:hypothetical protein